MECSGRKEDGSLVGDRVTARPLYLGLIGFGGAIAAHERIMATSHPGEERMKPKTLAFVALLLVSMREPM